MHSTLKILKYYTLFLFIYRATCLSTFVLLIHSLVSSSLSGTFVLLSLRYFVYLFAQRRKVRCSIICFSQVGAVFFSFLLSSSSTSLLLYLRFVSFICFINDILYTKRNQSSWSALRVFNAHPFSHVDDIIIMNGNFCFYLILLFFTQLLFDLFLLGLGEKHDSKTKAKRIMEMNMITKLVVCIQ